MTKNILIMYSNHQPSKAHIARLRKIAPGFKIAAVKTEEQAIQIAENTEIILGHRYLKQVLPYARGLKWVQTTAGGYDRLPLKDLRERGILLSRTTFPADTIARHAYVMAWSIIRGLADSSRLQQKKEWQTDLRLLPLPKIALILGLGEIGNKLARLLKKDGIRVWGVKRRKDKYVEKLCDKVFYDIAWRKYLKKVDLCFLCVPLNRETKGIFNKSALDSLPKHAVVINVSRGEVLDTGSLIKLLKNNCLGGAGLDVFEKYPPAKNDPIWETPQLLMTPYIAGRYPERAKQIEEYCEQQVSKYLRNKKLSNLIDWDEAAKDYAC